MDAANEGAKKSNGLTIGILPTSDKSSISKFVDLPIITSLGNARNSINVLSSDVVIACGVGTGTISEIALALKSDKNVILLNDDKECQSLFKRLGKEKVYVAKNPEDAIKRIKSLVN
ncbi:Uncharacterised protein [uncultured archaeon]|nr:Uncharacterised protein [uncultured archaeon]